MAKRTSQVKALLYKWLKWWDLKNHPCPLCLCTHQLPNGDFKLTFDRPFTFDNSELSGFYFCCGEPGVCRWLELHNTLEHENRSPHWIREYITAFKEFSKEFLERRGLARCGEGIGGTWFFYWSSRELLKFRWKRIHHRWASRSELECAGRRGRLAPLLTYGGRLPSRLRWFFNLSALQIAIGLLSVRCGKLLCLHLTIFSLLCNRIRSGVGSSYLRGWPSQASLSSRLLGRCWRGVTWPTAQPQMKQNFSKISFFYVDSRKAMREGG